MNSYEFIGNVIRKLDGGIKTKFDVNMALFNLIGSYSGITVTNHEEINDMQIIYTISYEKNYNISPLMDNLNNIIVSLYNQTYIVQAEHKKNNILINLKSLCPVQ